ncbi:MAG TPA: metallophosphoesterase [Anaeromyxobacteraceae bacterium]|nr:metallophosphoesterase [Anaeromyxobacteraceae bacterium]
MPRTLSSLLFVLTAISILAGMHVYLWVRLVRDPGLPEPWRRIATLAIAFAAVALPTVMMTARRSGEPLAKAVPFLAFAWMGLLFLLFSALLAIDLARLAGLGASTLADLVRGGPERPPDPERRRFIARAVAGSAVVVAGGTGAYAFRSATGPALIEEVPVKLARLPPALSGLTIAQITDLHVGPTIGEAEVRRVVAQTNALRPDVVAITGDLVDGSVERLGRAVAELADLRARHGVFFVTGNHEYYSGARDWIAYLRGLGIRVLENERVEIGDRGPGGATIDLAGVNDYGSRGRRRPGGGDVDRALAGRDPDRGLVLLAHQPSGVDEAVRAGVELQISGHTHGGQIFPFNFLVAATYPYVRGLYPHREEGQAGQIYVSRGTGYWGPPMRLGSPPEIAKIVLVPA